MELILIFVPWSDCIAGSPILPLNPSPLPPPPSPTLSFARFPWHFTGTSAIPLGLNTNTVTTLGLKTTPLSPEFAHQPLGYQFPTGIFEITGKLLSNGENLTWTLPGVAHSHLFTRPLTRSSSMFWPGAITFSLSCLLSRSTCFGTRTPVLPGTPASVNWGTKKGK